jgi:hypothetical protein
MLLHRWFYAAAGLSTVRAAETWLRPAAWHAGKTRAKGARRRLD